MSIRSTKRGRNMRLSLRGHITIGCGIDSLREAVDSALRAGARCIEIDASGVSFLDAAGMGQLVACRKLSKAYGARFRLCGVAGKARELLRITGLDRTLIGSPRSIPLSGLRFRVA